jgi:hypothetical protein
VLGAVGAPVAHAECSALEALFATSTSELTHLLAERTSLFLEDEAELGLTRFHGHADYAAFPVQLSIPVSLLSYLAGDW